MSRVLCAIKNHNLSLKVDFLFQSFLVITVKTKCWVWLEKALLMDRVLKAPPPFFFIDSSFYFFKFLYFSGYFWLNPKRGCGGGCTVIMEGSFVTNSNFSNPFLSVQPDNAIVKPLDISNLNYPLTFIVLKYLI